MKYLLPIAKALNMTIVKATDCGYAGYKVINNKTGMTTGVHCDTLETVAHELAKLAAYRIANKETA
jgi:hypothetical protein